MTVIGQVLIVNFIGLIVAILGLWAGARAIRDVSFVDAFWPLGMVLLAWGSALQAGFGGQRTQLILALVTLWGLRLAAHLRSEEHTSELQSLMRISYAVFCLKKKKELQ